MSISSFLKIVKAILGSTSSQKINCIQVLKFFSKTRLLDFKDTQGRNLAQTALINRDFGVARCLISESNLFLINKDKQQRSLLCYALISYNRTIASIVVKKSQDMEAGFGQQGSALHLACSKLLEEIVTKVLLKIKNCEIKDHQGNTPLHKVFSVFDRRPSKAKKILAMLLSQDICLNPVNNQNYTPLALAIIYKNVGAIKYAQYLNAKGIAGDEFDFGKTVGPDKEPLMVLVMRFLRFEAFLEILQNETCSILYDLEEFKTELIRMGFLSFVYRKVCYFYFANCVGCQQKDKE